MVGLGTGAPIVQVYHEKSIILPDVSRVLACLYEKDIKFETHTASYKSLLRLQASSQAPVPFYDGPTFLEGINIFIFCRSHLPFHVGPSFHEAYIFDR